MAIRTLLLAALAAPAFAYCPNGCSGHGSCGINDKCECYKRPSGGGVDGARLLDAHVPQGGGVGCGLGRRQRGAPAVQCSNKGACDGKSAGRLLRQLRRHRGGERTVCPNDHNGRGICYTQKQLAAEAPRSTRLPGLDEARRLRVRPRLPRPDCRSRSARRARTCSAATATRRPRLLGPRHLRLLGGSCKCFVGYWHPLQYQTILG